MRWMVEAISRQPRPNVRAAAREVSLRMSGDLRHVEGLRKDYRRLKRAGDLPSIDPEDSILQLAEQVRAERERRAAQAAKTREEIAPLEVELRELGFDPDSDLSGLLGALDAERFKLNTFLHTFPPGPMMASWYAHQGYDPDAAASEAKRLLARRKTLSRALELVSKLRELRWHLEALTPQARPDAGEQ